MPPRSTPFERHHERYDAWFERHPGAYQSELLAVRALLPWRGLGLEVGVGTGRFAAPLGVAVGIDPAPAMLAQAARRGIHVAAAVAEALPFPSARFDYALAVTTLCFVGDPAAMLDEVRRVLKPGASLVLGFIDRDSAPGGEYLAARTDSVFYRGAKFHGAAGVLALLADAGFAPAETVQTLFHGPGPASVAEPLRPGRGDGAFVVVRADRP